MKTVLVLGASSFVGTYVINELLQHKEQYRIIGTGRNEKFRAYYEGLGIPYLNIDLNDKESFETMNHYDIDTIVLCAVRMPANVSKTTDEDDIADYYETNVVATCNLLEYCRAHHINQVVTFGSRFDTRLYPQDTLITEDTPLWFSYTDDHAGYVLSNIAKQQVMTYYNQMYQMDNIVFRLPTIIGVGPHGSYNKDGKETKSGLQIFIDKATAGQDIEIFGDPKTLKDWFYVKDLAIAVRCAIDSKGQGGFYNIGCGHNFTLDEIVHTIVRVFSDAKQPSKVLNRSDLANNGFFPTLDISKAKSNLGFEPQYGKLEDIFVDYKKELEAGVFSALFAK